MNKIVKTILITGAVAKTIGILIVSSDKFAIKHSDMFNYDKNLEIENNSTKQFKTRRK